MGSLWLQQSCLMRSRLRGTVRRLQNPPCRKRLSGKKLRRKRRTKAATCSVPNLHDQSLRAARSVRRARPPSEASTVQRQARAPVSVRAVNAARVPATAQALNQAVLLVLVPVPVRVASSVNSAKAAAEASRLCLHSNLSLLSDLQASRLAQNRLANPRLLSTS